MIFKFSSINLGAHNKIPHIRIELNHRVCHDGPIQDRITVAADVGPKNLLRIYFVNKLPSDTQVDRHGDIILDMNFTLANITAQGVVFDELLWDGTYVAGDALYESCLFFGPQGFYELEFASPILKHKLQKKFERGELDTHWEEDYNYYTQACEILKKL